VPPAYQNDMIAYTMDQVDDFDGGVILMHDIHQNTADQLEDLILALIAGGYSFHALDDSTASPRLNADNPYDFPWMGEACTTANDTCWQVEWSSWCEPTNDPGQPSTAGVCVLPCDGDLRCTDRDGTAPLVCADTGPGLLSYCLAEAGPLNGQCSSVPGTVASSVNLWGGGSSTVCEPYGW